MITRFDVIEKKKPGYEIDFDLTLDAKSRTVSWKNKTITVEGKQHTVPAGSIELPEEGKAFTILFKTEKGLYAVSPVDEEALKDKDALIIAHIALGGEPFWCEVVYREPEV